MNRKEIGQKIKEGRGEKTRKDFAKEIDVSLSALTLYENGERIPRDEIKKRIAKAINKSVEEIFFS